MARLVIFDGTTSKTVELTDATTVAGRAPENKIVIDDKQSSRRHFQIDRIEFGYKLVDLESRNGTRVNDRSVNQALLRPGDRIQIGKHVLTFEDPSFKEPPADVVARLGGAASGPGGRVDAPSSSPDMPPRASGLPVAQEVKPSAPAVTAPPTPDSDYRTKRNRSGHTTAVQKVNLQSQLREEQKTLTMVAVGAGVFIFVVLLLIFLPSSPSGNSAGAGKALVKGGPLLSDADRAEKEAHDFEELANYCDRNKNVPASFQEIINRVDQFEQKYPRSLNPAKLKEFRSGASAGLKSSRNAEYTEAEKLAAEDLRKNDFAGGLKKIRELLTKYKADADIHDRLVKLKEQAVEDARKYFQTRVLEADAVKATRKDEAREIYQGLLKAMGSNSIPELDDYCKIARVSIEGLQ
ncbi:MAG TPA: FHA domain-containing protein [Planctomycetota bacterium]|nr:FHA domain-containing protein [Planctomycetota bacterium]